MALAVNVCLYVGAGDEPVSHTVCVSALWLVLSGQAQDPQQPPNRIKSPTEEEQICPLTGTLF